MRKIVYTIGMLLCFGIATISIFLLGQRKMEDDALQKEYATIRKEVVQKEEIDWKKLRKENPDIVGWIKVKDTKIDYPVVQGENNQTYLHQSFQGTPSYGGCIFLDAACDMTESDNLLMYGHHMRDGSMFADLEKFRDASFAKKHRIYFYTPVKNYVLTVCAAYAKEEEVKIPITFQEEYQKENYLQKIKERNEIPWRIIRKDQKIFTFITCDYEQTNGRVYVHATNL